MMSIDCTGKTAVPIRLRSSSADQHIVAVE